METETRLQLKICGITKLEDARYAVAAGATHLGFIQDPRSERFIDVNKAREIIDWVYGAIPVGVFVDADVETVTRSAATTGFKMVQLHGSEPPDYCEQLDVPVIKVISILPDTSREHLQNVVDSFSGVVDWMMFDTSRSSNERKPFDWDLLKDLTFKKPFFLAGGITASNVEAALQNCNPNGIDVSSSLESSPGIKDFDRIDEFITKITDRL